MSRVEIGVVAASSWALFGPIAQHTRIGTLIFIHIYRRNMTFINKGLLTKLKKKTQRQLKRWEGIQTAKKL